MIQEVLVDRQFLNRNMDSSLLYKDENDRRIRFMNINEDATRAEMFVTAKALMSLMKKEDNRGGIYLREKYLLEEDTSQVKS